MILAVVQEATGDASSDVIFRWATLLTVQGVILVGIILGYFSTRSKVRDVSDQATLAAELAAPTGNGYANETRAALAEIKDAVSRVEAKVDTHIMDHASSSLRNKRERVLQTSRSG